jgi:hypothetical protein
VHYVPGVGHGEIEHGPLAPGQVARELRLWEELARSGLTGAPGSCGIIECCGTRPRGTLDDAIRLLPPRAKPVLARLVRRADRVYLSRTWPDLYASPQAPWWERRMPAR